MIAVIFEVWLLPGNKEKYLDIAKTLRPILSESAGFISVERFQAIAENDKMLSLSFFKDHESVVKWRKNNEHKLAQKLGRSEIFSNYRLRVAEVMRDYSLKERTEAPRV